MLNTIVRQKYEEGLFDLHVNFGHTKMWVTSTIFSLLCKWKTHAYRSIVHILINTYFKSATERSYFLELGNFSCPKVNGKYMNFRCDEIPSMRRWKIFFECVELSIEKINWSVRFSVFKKIFKVKPKPC